MSEISHYNMKSNISDIINRFFPAQNGFQGSLFMKKPVYLQFTIIWPSRSLLQMFGDLLDELTITPWCHRKPNNEGPVTTLCT